MPTIVHSGAILIRCALALVLLACGGGQTSGLTTTAPDQSTEGEGADPLSAPAPPSMEERCAALLERFGPEAVSLELEPCVETLTTSAELAECVAAGLGEAYIECVSSCMRSVDLGGEYIPHDVMANCRRPCRQVTCSDEEY